MKIPSRVQNYILRYETSYPGAKLARNRPQLSSEQLEVVCSGKIFSLKYFQLELS
jgi:hypothetical protein